MNMNITEAAVTELRANNEQDIQFYRLSVQPGGCSGFKYSLIMEDAAADDLGHELECVLVLIGEVLRGEGELGG